VDWLPKSFDPIFYKEFINLDRQRAGLIVRFETMDNQKLLLPPPKIRLWRYLPILIILGLAAYLLAPQITTLENSSSSGTGCGRGLAWKKLRFRKPFVEWW